jgi:hypothetical protein
MVFSGVWSRVYDEEFVALAMWDYCFMKAMGNDVGEILLVGALVGFTECFFPGMCNCAELENLSPGELIAFCDLLVCYVFSTLHHKLVLVRMDIWHKEQQCQCGHIALLLQH